MADHDQHSQSNLVAVEIEELTTIHQPHKSEPLDVEEPQVRIAWTEPEAISTPVDDDTFSLTDSQRSVPTSKRENRRETRFPRPHLFVTLSHWAMVILLGLSFITGIRLTWGDLEAPLHAWSMPFASVAPKGTLFGINIITLHVVISFFMLGVAGTYAAYMLRSGASRRLRVNRQTFQRLRQGAFERGLKWNRSSLWAGNLIAY